MSLYRPIYAPVLAKAHYSARTPQAMADDDGGCICGWSAWDVSCCIPVRIYWLTTNLLAGVIFTLTYPCSGDKND